MMGKNMHGPWIHEGRNSIPVNSSRFNTCINAHLARFSLFFFVMGFLLNKTELRTYGRTPFFKSHFLATFSGKAGYRTIFNVGCIRDSTMDYKSGEDVLESLERTPLSVMRWTTLVSSVTTMSTHFKHGSFNLAICPLTIASKAISGVKSPVLHDGNESARKKKKKKGEGGKDSTPHGGCNYHY